ncbi:hypothetical protein [Nonomuraea sp. CA-141351]|uniref:hypothetical protein n=1 Tax=Nonomuraea sp. CA-141351 TaxID=3239996 RepID=UPI003D8D4088
MVDWSWGLLDAHEQALARRLTVFAGGATLTDAEQVCGLDGPVGYDDVAGVLAGLVDKSLVEAHDGRYRMLETVREYCAERLAEIGERAECLRAHAECFTALAEAADHHLRGPDQLNWLARLGAEHGNLLAALGWAVTADPLPASRLLATLSWFWWLRGLRGEAAPLAARRCPPSLPVAPVATTKAMDQDQRPRPGDLSARCRIVRVHDRLTSASRPWARGRPAAGLPGLRCASRR